MKWVNESKDNPGYSVYYANPKRDPDVLYVIRKKKEGGVGWRVFVRADKVSALKTIYIADTLKEAKEYVASWEEQLNEHNAS